MNPMSCMSETLMCTWTIWTEPHLQSHITVALLYPSFFFHWSQLLQGLPENHLLHLSGEKRCSDRLFHTVPLLSPAVQPLLQEQWEGLSEPKASMEAFIFAVLTSSQQLTVFHPVCLMDLTGSKSWHRLQS